MSLLVVLCRLVTSSSSPMHFEETLLFLTCFALANIFHFSLFVFASERKSDYQYTACVRACEM